MCNDCELNDDEFACLKWFSEDRFGDGCIIIKDLMRKFQWNSNYCKGIVDSLYKKGLITIDSPAIVAIMTEKGACSKRTTEEGDKVITYYERSR